MKNLIFLCGSLRSGTTVLGLMFRYHPDIHAPGEYDFLFDYLNDEPKKTDKTEFYSCLRKNRVFRRSGLHIDNMLSPVEQVEKFVEQLVDDKKNRMIINVHRNFYQIPKIFPNAKYIHLIRDPRDVARSAIGMGWAGNVYHGVDIWIESENDWDKLIKDNPEIEYISVKFESLILKTKHELAKLCDFVGISYSDEMLDYYKYTTYDLPNPSLVEQWKRLQNHRERELVEWKLGNMLESRGYHASTNSIHGPGFLEKSYLLVDNIWKKNKFNIRRYGAQLYFLEKLARWFKLTKLEESSLIKMHQIDEKLIK